LFWWVCTLDPFWSFEDYGVCGHWKLWYSIVRGQVDPLCKYCTQTILEVRESNDDKNQRKFNPIIVEAEKQWELICEQ
jgi:hypothetical protein